MAKYGYTGAKPTQSSSSNSGVFGVNDVVQLLNAGNYKLQIVEDLSYLVIAGGGGGRGAASNDGGGGGGGAGGYRTSYGTGNISGANSAVESKLTLAKGLAYTVTVGAGGGQGNPSSFVGSDITDVVTVGDTVIVLPVEPSDHAYVVAPAAINVALAPSQIGSELTVTIGALIKETVATALTEQPLDVPVTV